MKNEFEEYECPKCKSENTSHEWDREHFNITFSRRSCDDCKCEYEVKKITETKITRIEVVNDAKI